MDLMVKRASWMDRNTGKVAPPRKHHQVLVLGAGEWISHLHLPSILEDEKKDQPGLAFGKLCFFRKYLFFCLRNG